MMKMSKPNNYIYIYYSNDRVREVCVADDMLAECQEMVDMLMSGGYAPQYFALRLKDYNGTTVLINWKKVDDITFSWDF